jgi:hypothetical protein
MDETEYYVWTHYLGQKPWITSHTEATLGDNYSENYLAQYIYFLADKDGNMQ